MKNVCGQKIKSHNFTFFHLKNLKIRIFNVSIKRWDWHNNGYWRNISLINRGNVCITQNLFVFRKKHTWITAYKKKVYSDPANAFFGVFWPFFLLVNSQKRRFMPRSTAGSIPGVARTTALKDSFFFHRIYFA